MAPQGFLDDTDETAMEIGADWKRTHPRQPLYLDRVLIPAGYRIRLPAG